MPDEEQKTIPASGEDGAENAGASLFSSLLSNPALMAKLPDIIATLKPIMAAAQANPPADAPETAENAAAKDNTDTRATSDPQTEPTKSVSGRPHSASPAHNQRIALLKALRPYMSPGRQNAIDYMLRMDKLGSLFRDIP